MAAVENDIVNYLLQRSEITDTVNERIYPLKLDEGESLPAITFQRISGTMQGRGRGGVLSSPIIQFSCWGNDYKTVKNLGDELITQLDGKVNDLPDNGQVTTFKQNDRELLEPESGLIHVMVEFQVNYGKET